jgi:hypothetical protein
MKCVPALVLALAVIVAHPLPAAAKGPSLSGQWTGAAKVTKCSKEVGNYQSLTAKLSMPDSVCPALGDTGEVITVTLKRR